MLTLYISDFVLPTDIEIIKNLFEEKKIAFVKKVELCEFIECELKVDEDTELSSAAVIYLNYWYDTPEAEDFRNLIKNKDEDAKLVYDDNKYWIIEKLEDDGRTERNALNSQVTSLRKARETHWMLKLRTVYPFGLNDRIGDEHRNTTGVSMIACRFPPLKRSAPTR